MAYERGAGGVAISGTKGKTAPAAASTNIDTKPKETKKKEEEKNKILPLQPTAYVPPSANQTPETGEEEAKKRWQAAADATKRFTDAAATDTPQLSRMAHVDDSDQRRILEQIYAAREKQQNAQLDYAASAGIGELLRTQDEAAEGFQSERDRIAAEEQAALDDQALYAEARGDRGGIGMAQRASIENTAALNRRSVNRAQQKLASDTARGIAELRARGEFEKADKLLSLTQSYLSELMQLSRRSAEANMDIDRFNTELSKWEADYVLSARKFLTDTELAAARVTGALADGTPTQSARDSYRTQLAAAGKALMDMGLMPTDAQLEAMGWTKEQYRALRGA